MVRYFTKRKQLTTVFRTPPFFCLRFLADGFRSSDFAVILSETMVKTYLFASDSQQTRQNFETSFRQVGRL